LDRRTPHDVDDLSVPIGLLAGILAGALWGLTFIAPLVAAPYSTFDLTVGRYLAYGLVSVAVLAPGRFQSLRSLSPRDWLRLVALGFTGNVGYYLAVSAAVPRAGTAVVALIIGCVPVVMSVLGNRGERRLPPRKLAPSLVLIAAGLLTVNGAAFAQAKTVGAVGAFATGVVLTLAALSLWTWYGLTNARILAERKTLSPAVWTALTGIGTLIALIPVLLIGWLAGWSMLPTLGLAGPGALRLVAWSLVLAVLCSWAATWAWSIAAQRLPVSLAGQLIVVETIFALLYGALYRGQSPGWAEVLGGALLIAGVVVALRTFHQARSQRAIAG
jgi:drug/metabolite transporter (DMT)-like permease